MKSHLLQTIDELKADGKSEQESIEIAISRFGEQCQLESELAKVFKIQRKFAKTILIVSLVSFLLAAICFIGYKMTDGNFPFTLTVPESLQIAVEHKIETGKIISNEEVDQLLTKYKKQFRYVAIFKENNLISPDKIYPSNFSVKEIENDSTSYLAKSFTEPNGIVWQVRYGFDSKGFNHSIVHFLLNSAKILFVVYWLLFSIWCVINAYHSNKLSLAWIILFITLNVIAYAIFELQRTDRLIIKASHLM